MSGQRKTNGSLALEQNNVIVIEAVREAEAQKLRVAAYCRVSSDSSDQMNSFAAQMNYYTTLISSKSHWELVDLYADAGISGTSAEKRPDFQRLLSDCRKGRIDKVLVKSISRFARNTMDCLKTIRELKAIGVGVCFEEQNIDSSMVSGEMLASIFASLAQKESESISQNMRMSFQRRMERGTFVPMTLPFGYKKGSDGRAVIDESTAKYVREIFESYLSGANTGDIAEGLEARKATTPALSTRRWTFQAVSRILRNEKYIGDSLWQKSYRTDSLPYRELKNHGERTQYYAKETHPAIIEKSVFEKTQSLLSQRKDRFYSSGKEEGGLRGHIFCSCCGAGFPALLFALCRHYLRRVNRPAAHPPLPEGLNALWRS